jgi:hypothetical protein
MRFCRQHIAEATEIPAESLLRKIRFHQIIQADRGRHTARSKFPLSFFPKLCQLSPVLPPLRGALRDRHGRWRRDAMDATLQAQSLRKTTGAAADGEIVWSRRRDAGAKSRR